MSALFFSALPFLQMWDGRHMDGSWGFGAWLTMTIGMLLFWAVIVGGTVWLLRATHLHGPQGSSAIDLARDRYARGEIGDEEFERIKRGLK